MKKIWKWLGTSNRWKHLVGGIALGILSDSWWCAALVGSSVGGAMEFKDTCYGNDWDWIDFGLTFAGALIGFGGKELML